MYAVLIQQLSNLHLCLHIYVSEEAIESEIELIQYQLESAQQCEEQLRRQRAMLNRGSYPCSKGEARLLESIPTVLIPATRIKI